MDILGLALVVLAAALLLAITPLARRGFLKLRGLPALSRLYRAVGLSVEDGTRLLISLGGASLLTKSGASALAGLGLLREAGQQTSVSDRPPVALAGEASLALLAQDALYSGFQAAGADDLFQPVSARLAGMTPFSSTAGTIPVLSDEHVSAAATVGHFGVEAALLADAAEREGIMLVGASRRPRRAGGAVCDRLRDVDRRRSVRGIGIRRRPGPAGCQPRCSGCAPMADHYRAFGRRGS